MEKLYKISVILNNSVIDRGVWADRMRISEGSIIFDNDQGETLALFPSQRTFITSIETREVVEERRKATEQRIAEMSKPPRK